MGTKTWTNVQVAMQSALAATKTFTDITKASTAVVTSTAHGFTDGDVLVLAVQGMFQLDGMTVRVDNATTNTFELEGVDSTDMDTFASGSGQEVTFGTTFSTIGDFSTSGGDFDMIDITTIHDSDKKTIPGQGSATECSGAFNWDPADAGQIAMKQASQARVLRAMKIQFSDGSKWYFTGYPGYSGNPTGSAGGKVTSPFKISGSGKSSFYAS